MIRDTVDSAEMPLRQEAVIRAARHVEGRYPRRCAPVANPARPALASSPNSESQEGKHRREVGDSSQVKLCRANPVSAPG